jgi:fumarate reductase subunit C
MNSAHSSMEGAGAAMDTTRARLSGARMQARLWLAQRLAAAVLALCVLVHLVTMIYAVRQGLSAAEILGRTRGNLAGFGFYLIFVAAVSIHAPIGLRAVLSEWFSWRGKSLDWVLLAFALVLALAGTRAAWGVFR